MTSRPTGLRPSFPGLAQPGDSLLPARTLMHPWPDLGPDGDEAAGRQRRSPKHAGVTKTLIGEVSRQVRAAPTGVTRHETTA